MVQSKIKSYAKINLALNVIGKKSALHQIESIITFVLLSDDIIIKKINSDSHKIYFCGKFSKNISKENTVSKLLNILEKKNFLGDKKFKITINKKIPNKAGLGGGSMNAASVLKYFLKKKIIKINSDQLSEICKKVGSDVILGLNKSNSILTSNNNIEKFYNCRKYYVLIVKPNFGCSTKFIFSKVKIFNRPKFNKPSKNMFNLHYLKKTNNHLEKIAFSKYPKLKSIKSYLETLFDPAFVRMTGSGSAIVAYYLSKERCLNAKKMFSKKYKNYWCIVSKTI